ncbi:MAG: tryptophan synthase subunit alpha [Deltaproteobacteria bacterium]|nr:tryptophan synthase subunit alpha [Deltaproteobacteria bacterium]
MNMALETYLQDRLKKKDILLMTHIVLGYPSFEDSLRIIEMMVDAGVDLMELQIPFSEPVADGPVILKANQIALRQGVTVRECLDFAGEAARRFNIPFLIMSYYNILFRHGVERFVSVMADKGLRGAIVPDLPPEEADEYLMAMNSKNLAPIFIFSPATIEKRMKYIAPFARGFIYCVARKGVTGAKTNFSDKLGRYLDLCRGATPLPLAMGFGVKEKYDLDFLKGKVDIAVIGSQSIRIMEERGINAVGDFIRSLW